MALMLTSIPMPSPADSSNSKRRRDNSRDVLACRRALSAYVTNSRVSKSPAIFFTPLAQKYSRLIRAECRAGTWNTYELCPTDTPEADVPASVHSARYR